MNTIAMLIPTVDQIGGAERQVLLLAKALAQRNWRVTVIALSGTGANVQQDLAAADVRFLALGMRKAWIDPRGWLRYLRWARTSHPDILHAHLPHATWFARCSRIFAPVPIVVDTIHTSRPASPGKRLLYRLTQKLGNHTTCVSHAVLESAFSARILDSEHASILHNGVELPHGTGSKNNNMGHFVWVSIGRLAPVKDYPTLIQSFAALSPRFHPTLTIVGAGPDEESLKALALELQLTSRVHFAGFHRDVQPFLAQADAFVLTSLWEGLPISVLEAQAANLPVVATDGAGTREAVDPNHTALLVPVGDVEALTSAMNTIMAMSIASRTRMGTKGRLFIEQHFSLPVIAEQWDVLYRQLLATHSRTDRRA